MAGNNDFQVESDNVFVSQGFIKYWEMRGQKGDMWVTCDTDEGRYKI